MWPRWRRVLTIAPVRQPAPNEAGQLLGAQERFDSAGRLLIEVEAALEVRVAAGISSVPKSEISRLRSGGGIPWPL